MGRRRKSGRPVNGWIILDKPVGMTSTSAVAFVKRVLNAQKAGHAGTLDPLASGCLPIALGEATKTVTFVMDGRKVYRFTVRWGAETETDDTEGDVTATSDNRPDAAAIGAVLEEFTGTISQVPPAYSAIKIAGERAYDLARGGEQVVLDARDITIHRLELLDCPDADTAIFEAECGKGTYVRALARDMGRRLGTRAHVAALRRMVVGPFDEASMVSPEDLEKLAEDGAEQADVRLQPVAAGLYRIPSFQFSERDTARIRSGQAVLLRGRDAPVTEGAAYAVCGGVPVAIGEIDQGSFNPKRVFNLNENAAPARPVD
jgi:tRNA pseudouridine55 synthase